jgi:putative intracellular protease/amidase
MSGAVHVLVFNGFADWEPALAIAELRRSGGIAITTVGFTDAPVASMGGLRVLPDRSLGDVDVDDVRLLLLPGGDMWEENRYRRPELDALLHRLAAAGVPIAAICGATLALARAGLLVERQHTSNMPGYLGEFAPGYGGEAGYVDALAVRDRGMITASGAAPVEFAREVLAELGVLSESDREVWYQLFKTGRMPTVAA